MDNNTLNIVLVIAAGVAIYYFLNLEEPYSNQVIDSVATKMAAHDIKNQTCVSSHNLESEVEPPCASKHPVPYHSKEVGGAAMGDEFGGVNITHDLGEKIRSGKILMGDDLLPCDKELNEFNNFKVPTTYVDSNLAANGVDKFGIDTIGSSRKNASQDLRGNIACPKLNITPFYNSTIDPDYNIKGLAGGY